jgi:hypothetical protein
MAQRTLTCPNCSARVEVPIDYFGATIQCPQCSAELDRRSGELAGAAPPPQYGHIPPPQYGHPQPPQHGGVPYPGHYAPQAAFRPYQKAKTRWWLIPLIAIPCLMVVGIFGLAAIPLITSGGVSATGEWHTHIDTAGGYRIEYPAAPATKTQQIPTELGPRTMYSSYIQRGNMYFECGYYDFGGGAFEQYEVDYDKGARGMAESVGGRIVSQRPYMVGHLQGSISEIEARGRYVTGLMVRHGNRLYIVVVENHTRAQQDVVDRFMASFMLLLLE